MPVIYIREQGTMLCKRGERLVVTKNNRMLLDQPLIGVDGVSVFGNVQISTQAAVMLMERGIDVSMFSYSGKYLGHLVSDKSKNIFLRMTQYVLKIDIVKFFDNIRWDILAGRLRQKIREEDVIELIRVESLAPCVDREGNLQEKIKGIYQGSCISPSETWASRTMHKTSSLYNRQIQITAIK